MNKDEILTDWGSIAIICSCQDLSEVKEAKDLKDKILKMDSDTRQISFYCDDCQNRIDYEVKIRLFELLEGYYQLHHEFHGFCKYITRKGQKIRLRYLKTLNIQQSKKEIVIIEAANLTTPPKFKE